MAKNMIGTRNYYEILPKNMLGATIKYPNEKKINVKLPNGFLVCGATGSCKTNWVLNFIELVGTFDRVTIYAKKLDEPLYLYLLDCLKKAGVQHEAFDNLDSVIPPTDYDSRKNNLVVVDDFMSAPKKSLEPIINLFTMGRKNGVTPLWLSQSFYQGTPTTIRNNVSYVVLFKLKAKRDMERILADVSTDLDTEQAIDLLKHIRSLGDTHFMLIDKATSDPKLKCRIDFQRN
jgi:hypothetical protein